MYGWQLEQKKKNKNINSFNIISKVLIEFILLIENIIFIYNDFSLCFKKLFLFMLHAKKSINQTTGKRFFFFFFGNNGK